MSKEIIGSEQVAKDLNMYFPEVKWDRFINGDIDSEIYSLYGWIDREKDSYKDFVFVMFDWDGSFTYWTSSAKYSEIFHQRINGNIDTHSDCERVEDWFPKINNVVRLKGDES